MDERILLLKDMPIVTDDTSIESPALEDLAEELSKYIESGEMSEKLIEFKKSKRSYEKQEAAKRRTFQKCSSMYEIARRLERCSKPDEALNLYLEILVNYNPKGSDYYKRPCIILEKQKRYDEAIVICERAIKAIDKGLFCGSIDEFEHRLNRLIRRKNRQAKSDTQ